MDYKKIFVKNACPTSIGGQAIMEGVMMRGPERTALAIRLPSDEIYLKTTMNRAPGRWRKVPLVRGVVSFFESLVIGMQTLMQSADILERYMPEEELEEPSAFEQRISEKYGEKALWNIMLTMSMLFAIVVSIAVFVIFPTVAVNWLKHWIGNTIALNLIEGVFRIILFILYISMISRMKDIQTLFQYHGAEHKTIHCFESGLELTPENAKEFYRLHPRCGTSFLMFVMIIALLLFSLLGWPNIWMRIGSRILLMPVIAGLSYEVLKWAGRSDNIVVRILSYPGLMLQKLTTRDPDEHQLEIAIVSLKAVLVDRDTPEMEGKVDLEGNLLSEENEETKNPISTDGEKHVDEKREVSTTPSETCTKKVENVENPMENVEKSENDVEKVSKTSKEVTDDRQLWPEIHAPRYDEDIVSVEKMLRWGQQCLSMVENGRNEAVDIFCYVMGYSRTDIILRAKELMNEDDLREYEKRINMRLTGTPLQYITGVQEFMGLIFRVNPNVLIPRLDTEVLVDQAIGLIRGKEWENPFILDLCTGSGAIGVTMAHEIPDAEVTLTDISSEALSTAMGNAQINGVFERCIFVQGNMFEAVPEDKKYDMILSNPPYIESEVIETLTTEVKDHEPRLALDGGADGLEFYRILANEAEKHLADGGILAMEIGHDQGESVRKLLEENGNYGNVAVLQDLNRLDRIVITERKHR